MNEFLQQFLIESREFVLQATEGLLRLEQSPNDAECLDSVFRAFHTLKGGAGIVEFAAMERAVHAAEEVLAQVRSGKRTLNPTLVGDSLACLDRVSQWLDLIEQTGALPSIDGGAPDKAKPAAGQPGAAADWIAGLLSRHPQTRGQATVAFRVVPDADCFYRGEDPLQRISSLQQLLALDVQPLNPWPAPADFDPYSCNLVISGLTGGAAGAVDERLRDQSGSLEVVAIDVAAIAAADAPLPANARKVLEEQLAVLSAKDAQSPAGRIRSAGLTAANVMRFCGRIDRAESLLSATEQAARENAPRALLDAIGALLEPQPGPAVGVADAPIRNTVRTLRIDAERIDALVRLTGELTVAKNAVGHTAKLALENGDPSADALQLQHNVLDRLMAELQRCVIGLRVLPLRSVLQRFPRVLREMSASLGKPVQLQLEGEDTEADKAIVEMLFEPLLHIVRNAIDHGIEAAEERTTKGKPAVATIQMRAERQGDQVLVEVSDDGRGIDVGRVREVAGSRGLISATDLQAMSDAEVLDLVFAPGFSTVTKVTELSGRGVGMDAVRTSVESVGGRVSIASRLGEGTTVTFLLPFSVMLTQVMTVEAGGQMFGVPLDAIVETVRVAKEGLSQVGNARVLVHRDRTIPVVELRGLLSAAGETGLGDETEAIVVIVTARGQLVGIRVDRPGEPLEVMLKALDGLLSGTPGIAGTTLLGDGRILLVLDVAELLQ